MNKEAKILVSIAVATIAILFGGSLLFNKTQTDEPKEVKVIDNTLLVGENPHSKGNPDARVTVVEFGDFQCPACAAIEPILRKMFEEYGDRVNFIFRQFPLEQHKNSFYAASVSEAAASQGKFWEMHDTLYEKQSDWGERSNAQELIEGYAKELGLDMVKLKSDIDKKVYDSLINTSITQGVAAGVNSTPTFFVNGKKQTLLSYLDWKTLLDKELSQN